MQDRVGTGMSVAKGTGDRQARGANAPAATVSAFVREAVFATALIRPRYGGRVSRAARSHAVNEDWHSALDGTAPLFVVADGVSSGAMASRASRRAGVARLHETLDAWPHRRRRACSSAVLDADRAVRRSIASRTDASGRRDGGALRRYRQRRFRGGWSHGSAIAVSIA